MEVPQEVDTEPGVAEVEAEAELQLNWGALPSLTDALPLVLAVAGVK
jgi:hypothetical protein